LFIETNDFLKYLLLGWSPNQIWLVFA
jgi:hypothetical protein